MNLESLVNAAARLNASDLHLEPGLPAAVRVQGKMKIHGDPVPAGDLLALARTILGEHGWSHFTERQSFDLSRTIGGVRCRINVLRSSRGVGFAIRLLSSFQPTLERLNLHPELRSIVRAEHGLVLMCGPTGCGKSSTLAALIHEINTAESRHIVTLESPIEFAFRPRRCYIRQREVGRDTPSFEQGLIDAMREDPDVLMVGEMRDPETMRLTLNAAETGHLVFSTLHSSSGIEAIQRMVHAFPPESQAGIRAQLADCLRAIVTQRLTLRYDVGIRLPELEIIRATSPVRSIIRQNALHKLQSTLETGSADGQWTFRRYSDWIRQRQTWFMPDEATSAPDADPRAEADTTPLAETLSPGDVVDASAPIDPTSQPSPSTSGSTDYDTPPSKPRDRDDEDSRDVIVIDPPPGESIGDILSELDDEER